jgi:hypothetical protein
MAVESVSGYSWNECPDQRGISVRILVEWPSGWSWSPHSDHKSRAEMQRVAWQFVAPGGLFPQA